jgi:PPOX class probable F420-dependent enzyme
MRSTTDSRAEPTAIKENQMRTPELANEQFVSITTFKRDGTDVSTPVWVAADNGNLLVISEADTWKVKRIRRDHHVRIAPCNARGTPRGEPIDADATIDDDTSTVEQLLAQKYGWKYRAYMRFSALVRKLRRQPIPRGVTIRITPR